MAPAGAEKRLALEEVPGLKLNWSGDSGVSMTRGSSPAGPVSVTRGAPPTPAWLASEWICTATAPLVHPDGCSVGCLTSAGVQSPDSLRTSFSDCPGARVSWAGG